MLISRTEIVYIAEPLTQQEQSNITKAPFNL